MEHKVKLTNTQLVELLQIIHAIEAVEHTREVPDTNEINLMNSFIDLLISEATPWSDVNEYAMSRMDKFGMWLCVDLYEEFRTTIATSIEERQRIFDLKMALSK